MKDAVQALAEEYTAALKEYLAGREEALLQRAYELGRKALAGGLGVVEMVTLHREAMVNVSPAALDQVAEAVSAAGNFLAESLSPFEMTHRGFREANAALQVSEARYRELFENANDIIFTTDLEGNFTSINRAGEQLSGYQRDETASMSFAAVIAPEDLERAWTMLQRKLTGQAERTSYELEILTKDGRRVPLEVSTRLIYHEGKPAGIQGIARDVTERKRAEQAVRRLNEVLEEETRRLAHALHDEAGQLLVSVYLALEEIGRELPARARGRLQEVTALLDQIEEQLRRLSHELRPTILDDLGLVPAVEFLAGRVAKRSGLRIGVEGSTGGRLPPLMETALYRSVQEALANVARHAQATRVRVHLRREARAIRCSVRDDGVGFDVGTVLARRGDRGLGLVGIRERAGALGGTLEVISAPGRGTELLITIPLGT
ncbi:MAG: PAS domain S-box protein [Candidatus Rokubacteria bacterium]|nr:PAS domain S-box protein [Candidatus Rokubacteria bacterium]